MCVFTVIQTSVSVCLIVCLSVCLSIFIYVHHTPHGADRIGPYYLFSPVISCSGGYRISKKGRELRGPTSGGFKGAAPAHAPPFPPAPEIFLNFMKCLGNIWQKSYVGAHLLEGWRPLLWGILDPPLPTVTYAIFFLKKCMKM